MKRYGWDEGWAEEFAPYADRGWVPGRVCLQQRGAFVVWCRDGEVSAVAKRKLHRSPTGPPAIGDWVAVVAPEGSRDRGHIEAVLPRRTKISRKVAGARSEEQVVTANVDSVFVMMGLDVDFNLRRLERFLVVVWESGAEPVVVLNKADMCENVAERVEETERIAPGVAIVVTSLERRTGIEALSTWLQPGRTVALLGSSGVGKSTLVNALSGAEVMETGSVRVRDDRGKHTTSHRRLLLLPGGALLVDNPGIRELQLWTVESGDDDTFAELEALARDCRFRDCSHEREPGCAVLLAVEEGRLDSERLANFRGLKEELAALGARRVEKAQQEESRQWKKVSREPDSERPR